MIERDTRKISVSKETLLNLGAKIIQAVFGFGGIILFTRMVGSEGIGKYRTVTAAAFIITIFSRSFGGTIKKRISEVDTDSSEYLTLALIIHGGLTIVAIGGLFTVKKWAVNYFGSLRLVVGLIIIVASLGLFHILTSYQAGIGYPARSTWLDTLRSVLTLLAQVLLIALGYQALGIVLGLGFATLVTSVVILLLLRPTISIPSLETVRRTYTFARYRIPSNFVEKLYQSADPLLIKTFSGVDSVGFYTVASQIVMPGSLFSNSISNALSVKSSGVASAGGSVQDDLTNSLAYCGLVSIPIFFGTLALPDAIIQMDIFGKTYTKAPGGILIFMAAFQVINTFEHPYQAVINGSDRPDVIFRSSTGVLITYLIFSVALGYFYGVFGVIAGTVLSEILRLGYYQIIVTKWFESFVFPRPAKDQIVSGLVMFIGVELVSIRVDTENMIPLIMIILLGAIIYFLTLLTISSHFRSTIHRTIYD
ncbi:MAG: lipopolysaccharide biosynthesis protein [Candidatus Paceibacteria bacterium]